MSTIKKAYTEIVELLEAHAEHKVKSILPQVIELASAKTGGGGGRATTFHKNADGIVVAIRCFYFGLWMSPEVAEFGKKASSSTGFNSMCKAGVSLWTKQQRDAKKAREELLTAVADGSISPSELPAQLAGIEEARAQVEAAEYGFETLDECLADNAARGLAH